MRNYVVRRLLLMIPTLLLLTILVFLLARLIPGSAIEIMVTQGGTEGMAGEATLERRIEEIKTIYREKQ